MNKFSKWFKTRMNVIYLVLVSACYGIHDLWISPIWLEHKQLWWVVMGLQISKFSNKRKEIKIKRCEYNIYPWHHLHYRRRALVAYRSHWYYYPLPLEMYYFALYPMSNGIPFRNYTEFQPPLQLEHLYPAIVLAAAAQMRNNLTKPPD